MVTAGFLNFTQPAAHAATVFTVNSTGDGADINTADNLCNDGSGNCTLRAAIEQANATAGADTVGFSVTGTINLTGALPDIVDDLTLNGPGSSLLTVRRDTGGDYRIFTFSGGSLVASLNGLTVANGRTPDGFAHAFGGSGGIGGGLFNGGTLTMTDVTLTGNRTGVGGSIGANTSFGGPGGSGGAVWNFGTLTMTNVTLTGNSTGAGGEGFTAGEAGDGGAIYNDGTLTMNGCVVRGNSTGGGGRSRREGGRSGDGGGIYSFNGTFTMTDCTVSDNTTGAGGDSDGSGGGSTIRGGGGGHGAGIFIHVFANLTRVSISNNVAGDGGSAPLGVPGEGGSGGGLYNDFASVKLTNCAVSGNRAGSGQNGRPGNGGGIGNSGTLTVLGSTISGNTGNLGGALLNSRQLSMANTTISGNHLTVSGGAVNNDNLTSSSFTNATLTNCTITANEGPGYNVRSTPPVLRNTIIAGNGGGSGPDVSGSFSSGGHNLVGNVGDASGFTAAGDRVGTSAAPINARLGPLADNGSPTLTHALLAGSPALDAGDNALALDETNNALTTDQRGAGFARRADAADADTTQTVDIGAFEAHPSVEDIADKATNPNTPLSFSFNVGDAALGIASVTASSGNTALVPNNPSNISVTGSGSTRTLTLTPTPGTGTSTINVTATGTDGRSMSDIFVFSVLVINQAPTLAALGDLTINEDAGSQTVNLSGISAGPGETQNLTVTATSSDTALLPNPTVTYTSPSSNGSVSFAPAANMSGTATVTVTVTDDGSTAGGVNTFSRTFNVTVNAVNDPPVNAVPVAQSAVQHTPFIFSTAKANAISVADIDAGTDAIKVTLTAANGTVTLGSNAGLTFVNGDGTDDASVSFTGTINAINAALNGLSFTPARGFSGATTLQIVTNDQGRNGSGGAMTDTDSVTVNVASGGTLQFSAAAYEVSEHGTSATITVTRTGGGAGAASVRYETGGGTAAASIACDTGIDYIGSSGTLNWADGETASKTFTVNVCVDPFIEGDEIIGLSLRGPEGSAILGTNASALLTIKDVEPTLGAFEFSRAAYDVAEGGTLTVIVRRTGAISAAASVEYRTDDGHRSIAGTPCSSIIGYALERCDFTTALGTLNFAAGEIEKTFVLLVGDDSYVEGPETFSLLLDHPTGPATFGTITEATVTIADDSPESAGNPIDDDTKFVTQHYRDFLNRDPDAPGLAFWKNELASCGQNAQCREVKRINVSAAFFLSIEFQETGYLVYRIYKTAFGDSISPNVPGTVPVIGLDSFLPDTQRIGQGVVVNQGNWQQQLAANKQAYALEFVQRQRFLFAFPESMTAEVFVSQLDQNAGGVLSADERAQLVASLGATPSDATKRAAVLRQVAEHQTLRQREFNRAFVLTQYFGYLRRNPNDAPEAGLNYAGWKFWLDKLDEFNGNFVKAEMVKAFLSSDEYRKRFG